MMAEKIDICINEKGQLCNCPGLAELIASGEPTFDTNSLTVLPINFLYSYEDDTLLSSYKLLGLTGKGIEFGYSRKYMDQDKGW